MRFFSLPGDIAFMQKLRAGLDDKLRAGSEVNVHLKLGQSLTKSNTMFQHDLDGADCDNTSDRIKLMWPVDQG